MKNVKHTGFSAFHLENEEKNVDSCRAASQPISLFLHHMFLTFLQKTEVYLIGSMHSMCNQVLDVNLKHLELQLL